MSKGWWIKFLIDYFATGTRGAWKFIRNKIFRRARQNIIASLIIFRPPVIYSSALQVLWKQLKKVEATFASTAEIRRKVS